VGLVEGGEVFFSPFLGSDEDAGRHRHSLSRRALIIEKIDANLLFRGDWRERAEPT